MIIDKALQLSSAQAITASAASAKVVDLGAAGDAYNELWVVGTVTTSFTGSGTLTVSIQTATDEAFTTPVTLIASPALAASSLTAGTEPVKFRLPQGKKQYIRAYYTASAAFTAGAMSLNIVKDVTI